jgi:predicted ribosome quality control (RQC) complex YloA/Tae2 family protein
VYDVLTLAAIVDEMNATAINARIQKVGLVDRLTFGAELYTPGRRRWLVASADSERARLHLASATESLDPELITPFGLLLRKYVRGSILIGVEQEPLERIVRLSIAKRLPPLNGTRRRTGAALAAEPEPEADEDGESLKLDEDSVLDELDRDDITHMQIIIEVMGRHSNIMLVDNYGLIMDAVKHVTPAMSRVRQIRPRLPYTLPPAMDRPDPRRLTAAATTEMVAAAKPRDEIARLLVSRLRAVSPQIAREAVFRATGDMATGAGQPDLDLAGLAREVRGLYEPLLTSVWEPFVYRQDEAVVAFSPFPLHSLEASSEVESMSSMSEAARLGDDAKSEGAPVSHSQRRERMLATIAAARDRVDARLASLEAQEMKAVEAERLREQGELIYAYLWQITPGDSTLDVDGQTIALDPGLSAKDNAAEYFQRYRKAQGASRQLPELEEQATQQLAYLEQLATMVRQAPGFLELEGLANEWDGVAEQFGARPSVQGRGRALPRSSARADRRPKAMYDDQGHAIYIGRSGRQNDAVTFDVAGADDTWLHARGVPGSHVVIKWRTPMPEEDERTIALAASLAAWYSGSRNSGSVEVDVTRRRHVRKIKGTGPGMVTYRQERTISVPPRDETALKTSLTVPAR